jgi:hypothetical protein
MVCGNQIPSGDMIYRHGNVVLCMGCHKNQASASTLYPFTEAIGNVHCGDNVAKYNWQAKQILAAMEHAVDRGTL